MEGKEKKVKEGKSYLPLVKKWNIKEIGLHKLVLILLIGIFLLVLSFPNLLTGENSKETESTSNKNVANNNEEKGGDLEEYTEEIERRLKNTLKKVEGIGSVEVMITLKSSKEQVTLKDKPYSLDVTEETDSQGGSRKSNSEKQEDTSVIVKSEDGDQVPYVTKEIEPKIEGVVVIAEGGGNSVIINEIIGAIEVLFDVPTHKIKVMKMNVSGTSK